MLDLDGKPLAADRESRALRRAAGKRSRKRVLRSAMSANASDAPPRSASGCKRARRGSRKILRSSSRCSERETSIQVERLVYWYALDHAVELAETFHTRFFAIAAPREQRSRR